MSLKLKLLKDTKQGDRVTATVLSHVRYLKAGIDSDIKFENRMELKPFICFLPGKLAF